MCSRFVITDGKGSYIRFDEASGKYVPIRDAKKAKVFESRTKASNILNNALSKETKKRFHVKDDGEVEVPPQQVQKPEDRIEVAANTNIVFDSRIDQIVSSLNSAKYVMETAKDRVKDLNEMLIVVNSEINDILHYVEFTNLNLYQAWLIYKLLKETRRKRRAIKDELLILEKIGDGAVLTGQIVESALSSASGLKTRKYDPRSLSILFKGEEANV